MFEIPEGSVYIENTASVGGDVCDNVKLEGNTLILPVSDTTKTIRLCLMPTTSGKHIVLEWLCYKQKGKEHIQKLGMLDIVVESLKIVIPETTYTSKVYVSGVAPAFSKVQLFDGKAEVGRVDTTMNGIWNTFIELNNPGSYSSHSISAVFTLDSGMKVFSDTECIIYHHMDEPISISKVKMYAAARNSKETDFNNSRCVIFDYDNPDNSTKSYSYNPSLPVCHFLVLFNGDAEKRRFCTLGG